jgi:cobalt-zinc-cadmium efflux system outer membrane protein
VDAHARRAQVFGTEILPTLETNLALLQKAFELGEIDVLQVMVAQERFLRTQQDALQSFADYYAAWAELEGIVGMELEPSGTHAPAEPTEALP